MTCVRTWTWCLHTWESSKKTIDICLQTPTKSFYNTQLYTNITMNQNTLSTLLLMLCLGSILMAKAFPLLTKDHQAPNNPDSIESYILQLCTDYWSNFTITPVNIGSSIFNIILEKHFNFEPYQLINWWHDILLFGCPMIWNTICFHAFPFCRCTWLQFFKIISNVENKF